MIRKRLGGLALAGAFACAFAAPAVAHHAMQAEFDVVLVELGLHGMMRHCGRRERTRERARESETAQTLTNHRNRPPKGLPGPILHARPGTRGRRENRSRRPCR